MGVWSILPARYAGDSKSTRFFFFAFFCVGSRFPWGVHFAGCFHGVGFTTDLVTKDTVAGVWRIVSTGGLGFVLPVLLSLQSFFGVGVGSDEGVRVGSVRFVSYSYREESGWSSFAGVALLLDDLESPAVVWALDLFCLGDENGHSAIQAYIDFIGVPIVAKVGFKNIDVASSEASSSTSWSLASSCKSGVPFFQGASGGRLFWTPATKDTGFVLQGLGCNCFSLRIVLVTFGCKLLYQ
ncbi:unnamed protein product [Urochloa humidicola]